MTEVPDSRTAVMVMAYGGPDCLEAVGPFMCELIGREIPDEMLARVQKRYELIGGKSPLPEIACEIAGALEAGLAAAGRPYPVVVGFRYTAPRIEDTLAELHDRGVRRVIAVSLSPFESKSTATAYESAARKAVDGLPDMDIVFAPPWHLLEPFVAFHAEQLGDALARIDSPPQKTLVVFTAHSLPVADLETPERYASGLRSVASSVAKRLGLPAGSPGSSAELPGIEAFGALDSPRPWLLAYQSKGQRPGEWLGPDVSDVMQAAARAGFSAVVLSPIGFATEHMETLYDLDIVEAQRADALGLGFARGVAPNADPDLIAGVVGMVIAAAGEG